MKRNLNENSARSTAGCLPVPLFNQKKRSRQPLTSKPFIDDPGISTASDSYDSSALPPDSAWEMMKPELPPLMKTMNTGQISHSVSHPPRSQDSVSKSIQSNPERSKSGWSYGDRNKNTSQKTWDRNEFSPQCKRRNLVANDGINSCPSMDLEAQQQKQLRISEPPNLFHQKEAEVLRQTHSSKISGSTLRRLDENSALQGYKPNFQQKQLKEKVVNTIPEENTLKKDASLCPLKIKEKDNSLRIISAVIESMKYWHKHAQKSVLLFEILGVLDSAVTLGPHHSKTFLLRDGKNTLPCVFYEILIRRAYCVPGAKLDAVETNWNDRELPRLIRGRVHRCVGNYDQKKNIFKCVSVRPASVSEQKTFQAFLETADAEMKHYTSVINEI